MGSIARADLGDTVRVLEGTEDSQAGSHRWRVACNMMYEDKKDGSTVGEDSEPPRVEVGYAKLMLRRVPQLGWASVTKVSMYCH